jgi:hypothetical protein
LFRLFWKYAFFTNFSWQIFKVFFKGF